MNCSRTWVLQDCQKGITTNILYILFPFVSSFTARATGPIEEAPMTKASTMYSYLICYLTEQESNEESISTSLREMRESIRRFQKIVKAISD